jgi:hypothetical protein
VEEKKEENVKEKGVGKRKKKDGIKMGNLS